MEATGVFQGTRNQSRRARTPVSPSKSEERSDELDRSSGRDDQPGLTRNVMSPFPQTPAVTERRPRMINLGLGSMADLDGHERSRNAAGMDQVLKTGVVITGARTRGLFDGDTWAGTQLKQVHDAVRSNQPQSHTLSGRTETTGNNEHGRKIIHPDQTLLMGDGWNDEYTMFMRHPDQTKSAVTRPGPISRSGRGYDQTSEV